MQIIDGKVVCERIYTNLSKQVELIKTKGITPTLAVVLVGDNPSSLSYIRSKQKASLRIGVELKLIHLEAEETDTEKLIKIVGDLDKDPTINGLIVQLPLPKHIDTIKVIKEISPDKDVDGFHNQNVGEMFLGGSLDDGLFPCTAKGVIRMLQHYNVEMEGANAVVIGASNIAGKPIAAMLLNEKATVSICHSKTANIYEYTKMADILVAAAGVPGLIKAEMVKEGATVIDVGITRLENNKLVGDVDFENVSKKVSGISPVPGGSGLVTVACLMENLVTATKKQLKLM